jgi:hypothetical protein
MSMMWWTINFFIMLIVVHVISNDDWLSAHSRPCLLQSMENTLIDSAAFDCSMLSSDIRTNLALQLTFCHLNSTGIDPRRICSLPIERTSCLTNITKNSFAYLTYTNFLPHVQSLCYAMETQRWHHQARTTVHQLHRYSDRIEYEAQQLLNEQDTIEQNLDRTLRVNQYAVDDALNIDRYLQTTQADVDHLRTDLYIKDKEQIELIHQVE